MSDALDYVRNNCGIAGEEVAEMVDSLKRQVSALFNNRLVEEPLRRQIAELELLREQAYGRAEYWKSEHLAANDRITILENVCEQAANAIEYLIDRADDSDDVAYGTLSTSFVRDCIRDNLTAIRGVLDKHK